MIATAANVEMLKVDVIHKSASAKPAKNLLANLLQLIINQAFGLVIFLVLSAGLSKPLFGQVNFVLATLLVVFNILSFGIDQVVVKKIAAGEDAASLLNSYLIHVGLTGGIFYAILLLVNVYLPIEPGFAQIFLIIGFGKTALYLSTPFKQVLAGFQRFGLMSGMLVISNIAKGIALLYLFITSGISLQNAIIVFAIGDVIELLLTIFLFRRYVPIPSKLTQNSANYLQLMKESSPQIGVVIFTSALARFDWIYLGLTVPAANLAEYSFAYKIFEISTMPLLVVAPILLPKFAKIFAGGSAPADKLKNFLRIELAFAVLVSVTIVICWSPIVDAITHGKYGDVNFFTIAFLSLSAPFLYFNNFLWSIAFAQGRLKMILGVIALTFAVNVIANVVLIPIYKKEGAAIAYLLAMLVQGVAYLWRVNVEALKNSWQHLILFLLAGIVATVIPWYFTLNLWASLPSAMILFLMLLLLMKQLRRDDIKYIREILSGGRQ